MKRKPITVIPLLFFLSGAVFTGYHIYNISAEYHTSEKVYQNLQQYAVFTQDSSDAEVLPTIADLPGNSAIPDTSLQTGPAETKRIYPSIDFEALKQINEDVVGWIYLEGTNINYPVVQGADNRHYVSALIDGTYNGSGSIFMDYRNQSDFSDPHCILYGHNMQNGSMFHDICNYKEPEYYDNHPTGMLITPEQNFYFEIVSAYVASLADPAWQLEFVDDADLLAWLSDSMERSSFVSSVQPQLGDRIITLSTCSYEYDNARYVLVGILKEEP